MSQSKPPGFRHLAGLTVGALGVVYGDIGTSPLYALRECFAGPHGIAASHANVRGVLSLIFWSLIIIVSVKYLIFVMRANNGGEGGILTLLSLAFPEQSKSSRPRNLIIGLGIFGAALLYGDGIITPAISVLSAVEGLNVATPIFDPYIIPITVLVLVLLFSFQRVGTGRVGRIFGPVMLLWFAVLVIMGLQGISRAPDVLTSINPAHAVEFFLANRGHGFVVLGAVFLVVTGGEALYADMGHFGIRPIRLAWFWMVLPALVVNYFGQGALLLVDPSAARNPFYLLAPAWSVYPLVVLSTLATVIASQALISGAYSLSMQAIQLGYFPRLEINHTSRSEKGQIYMPQVNWTLMVSCIALVIGFGSSSHLAAAYGVAVTLTMVITTLLFYFAARRLWNWNRLAAGSVAALFLIPELSFFGANALKILHGGWVPLVVGAAIYTLMATWKTGRKILHAKLADTQLPFSLFLEDVLRHPPLRVRGTAIFLSGNPHGTPIALLHNLKHNKVLHERVVLMTLLTDPRPHVLPEDRVRVENLGDSFFRVTGHYGFMDEPSVPEILDGCARHQLQLDPGQSTFFLSRESIVPTDHPGMARWRESLFALMSRNAQHATAFFNLPANRVVELGMQVGI